MIVPPIFKTAFKFLLYDKAKSIGALLGIVISTFLIGQQLGIFFWMAGTMDVLVRLNPEYIWVVDNKTENANALGRLDSRIEFELKSIPGVKNVHPLFVGGATVQVPGGNSSAITLVGASVETFVGFPKEFYEGSAVDLIPDGAVSVDIFEGRTFSNTELGTTFEINGRKAYVAARTRNVRGFGGVLVFTALERARNWSGVTGRPSNAFLVETEPDAERAKVIAAINENIFGVRAWEGKEFGKKTVQFILTNTSIATSFGTLVIFAFISGFFIVGLTLFSAAIDRMKDYGTMKAIGATNSYIRKLIYSQAFLFAVVGFFLGYLLILAFKAGVAKQGLLIQFSPWFLGLFFTMICVIAVGGATFASRRITRLEPAEVFRF
ncbi:MAG: FtsX-like permease family protein [Bacteroidetes bacterium]|nr:MAG: FtsX-like permease family protein [Bacteroidota bacterium]